MWCMFVIKAHYHEVQLFEQMPLTDLTDLFNIVMMVHGMKTA